MTEAVPVVDLCRIDSDEFVRGLRAAFEEYGFALLANHGIAEQLCARFLAVYRQFFALPEAVKRRYHIPGGGGARGYTPFGIETAKGARHCDLKEFWHVGRELPDG
ncbi:MAG: 2-oxoglutarate and iron-dependent oxygenase domain-containing protein, partial [Steroidobacteraceae bacterium]|nr:2-oxoglutarate and iron-dependent oxygenase domain-containing protein [Steroidobacteraceae bacterium]MDW8259069.1 2-oxoglutarate and iron-dependent oxygenase domain-containing protein [Gammaproteobacteria bacterium]